MADVELKGVREMVERLKTKPRQVRAAAASGLYDFGDRIMKMSKDHYVPVDTHALQNSGQTGRPETRGDDVSVKLSYGGAAAPYAVYVHEITWYHHPHGQAKYLEAPLKMMGTPTGIEHFLAKPIREALERGAAR